MACKWIRKFYEEDDGYVTFTYCNWTSWNHTVSTVDMLSEEILKDFPSVSKDDMHIGKRKEMPYEITLSISFPKFEVTEDIVLKFEEMKK